MLSRPSIDLLIEKDFGALLGQPFAILGALDLFLAVMLVLQMVSLYSLIRFRIIFGLGFIGFILWSQSDVVPMISLAVASVGMYFCTIFVSYLPLAVAIAAGFTGMAGFVYFMLA